MAFDWLQQYQSNVAPHISLPDLPTTTGKIPGQYGVGTAAPYAAPTPPKMYGPASKIFLGTSRYVDPAARVLEGLPKSTAVFNPPPKQGAIFPEQISVPLTGIWDALNHPAEGIQTLLGNLKLLPGNPVGEAAGSVGRFFEHTPVEGAVNFVKDVITSPFNSAGYLFDPNRAAEKKAAGFIDIGNPEFWNDPFGHLKTNVFVSRGELGAGLDLLSTVVGGGVYKAAGKTAAEKLAANLSLNVLEKITQSGIAKGSASVLRGFSRPLERVGQDLPGNRVKDWFLGPIKEPLFRSATTPEKLDAIAKVASRVALSATTVGAVEGTVIEKLAPNSWAADNIARNRVVEQDSAWGVAFDVAVGMGLDVHALGKLYFQSAAKAAVAERIFGPVANHLDGFLGDWRTAATKNPALKPVLEWAFNKGIQDAAYHILVDESNARTRGAAELLKLPMQDFPPAVRANQLGFHDQQAYDDAIKRVVADLRRQGGWKKVYEEALSAMEGSAEKTSFKVNAAGEKIPYVVRAERAGWDVSVGADKITRLNNLEDYYKQNQFITSSPLGDKITENIMNDMILRVKANPAKEITAARGWLSEHPVWQKNEIHDFAEKFPGIAKWFDDPQQPFLSMTKDELLTKMQLAEAATISTETLKNPMWQMGKLSARYNEVRRAIYEAGANVSPDLIKKRNGLAMTMDAIREDVTAESAKLVNSLKATMDAREAETKALTLTATERIAAQVEYSKSLEKYHAAVEHYFDAMTIGTRYEIGYAPKGAINKVMVDSFTKLPYAVRNSAGRKFDRLFGGVSNVQLGMRSYKFVADEFMNSGLTRAQWGKVFDAANEFINQGSHQLRGMTWQLFRNAWDITPGKFEDLVKATVGNVQPKNYKTWGEVLYRAKPGPFRIAQEALFNRELVQMPYNKAFHSLTRSYFPIVKFSLSPRFLLMTMFDQDFFKTFLGGAESLNITAEEFAKLRALAETDINVRDLSETTLRTVEQRMIDISNLAGGRVAAYQMDALLEAIRSNPAHRDLMADYGLKSKEQMVQFLKVVENDVTNFQMNRDMVTAPEKKLAQEIENHQQNIDASLTQGEWMSEKASLDLKQNKLDVMRTERQVKAEAERLSGKPVSVPTPNSALKEMWKEKYPNPTFQQKMAIGKLIKQGRPPISGAGYASDLKMVQGKLAPDAAMEARLRGNAEGRVGVPTPAQAAEAAAPIDEATLDAANPYNKPGVSPAGRSPDVDVTGAIKKSIGKPFVVPKARPNSARLGNGTDVVSGTQLVNKRQTTDEFFASARSGLGGQSAMLKDGTIVGNAGGHNAILMAANMSNDASAYETYLNHDMLRLVAYKDHILVEHFGPVSNFTEAQRAAISDIEQTAASRVVDGRPVSVDVSSGRAYTVAGRAEAQARVDAIPKAFRDAQDRMNIQFGSRSPEWAAKDAAAYPNHDIGAIISNGGYISVLPDGMSHEEALTRAGIKGGYPLSKTLKENGLVRAVYERGGRVNIDFPKGMELNEKVLETIKKMEKVSGEDILWDVSGQDAEFGYMGAIRSGTGADALRVELDAGEPAISGGSAGGESQALLRKMAITDERFQPFLAALQQGRNEAYRWSRNILMGNPDRNAAERLGNSFLLYWPLSYSIKSTKAMLGFMLDRGFGYKTNVVPAVLAAEVRKWHNNKVATDPVYAYEWQKNKQWNFLLTNLFPATPDETGVSLSPIFRAPLQMARGYKTAAQAEDSIVKGTFSIKRDADQAQQILVEQLKSGHLLGDFINAAHNAVFGKGQ